MTIHTLTARLLHLPPLQRRLLLIAVDALLLPLAVWLSFWLRLAEPFSAQFQSCLWLLPAVLLLGLPLYALSGQYKGLTRYVGSRALYRLAVRNGLLVLLLLAVAVMLQLPEPPRSSWLLLWVLLTGFTGLVRLLLRDVLHQAHNGSSRRRPEVLAVIYGAGDAGIQLAAALRYAHSHRVLAFLDDNPHLWGREVNGIPVLAPQQLPALVQRRQPHQNLLALPSIGRSRRRRIVADLQPTGIPVLQVPTVEEITSGRTRIDALRPIAIEELLGRDAVPPLPQLLGPGVADQVVLVSGAGGSIGSELCRQILSLAPRQLILLDNHEPSLHAIAQELGKRQGAATKLIAVLGSVTDGPMLDGLLRRHGIQVVFHAAAYKHVPMVESCPLAGLHNNVIGTWTLAQAAHRCGVERFTLISTDKAVRPTNVMGASKRVAELVVQGLAQEQQRPPSHRLLPGGSDTCFSMVRFGNVLGSSGSVVPVFREQIAAGGPITLTHPEIMRYFMTIPEAVQLVLQAGGLAQGGDLFLLDMGDPVRIKDLAEQMVRLSGLSLRNDTCPDGDIEIVCTGLRPGEKLYEELLISANAYPTPHPLIYRATEAAIPTAQLCPQLEALEAALQQQDANQALALLAQLVPEWQPSSCLELQPLVQAAPSPSPDLPKASLS